MSSVPSRGELYDWEQAHVIKASDADVAFYAGLLGPGRRVLELACGTGRVAGPLRATGAEVVGLDIDASMLAEAARRHPGLALVRGDMRRFAFGARFDLVVIAYNSLQLLGSTDDRRACLQHVVEHLAHAGTLAFEVHGFLDGVRTTEVEPEVLHRGPLGAFDVTLHGGLRHDLDARLTTYTRRFEIARPGEPASVVDDDIALYSFATGELDELLRSVGLVGHVEARGNVVERWQATRV